MNNYSIVDKVTEKISPVIRKLSDLSVKRLLGTEAEVMRISSVVINDMGETDEQVEATIIKEVLIKKPYSQRVQIFQTIDESTSEVNVGGLDLWELLPIEIRIPFKGNYEEEPVALKKNDLLIELLRDENGNAIPFIMQITRIHGAFHSKHIIGRFYEACLYRGALSPEISQKIQVYVNANKVIKEE